MRVFNSSFDHRFVDMTARDLHALPAAGIAAYEKSLEGRNHWMGSRFVPNVGGFGTSLDQATVFPIEQRITAAWTATGRVEWQELSWEQNPTQFHIINALAGLPILEYRHALITEGSTNLYVPDNPPRVIE